MRKVLFPVVLATLLLAAAAVALVQADRAASAERMLEEVYISACAESAEQLQALSLSLEKTLVSADPVQRAQQLTSIGRLSEAVRRNLTLIPLSHAAMSDTLAFANRLTDYTDALLPALMESGKLAANDTAQLSDLLTECTRLTGELALAMQTMEDGGLPLRAAGNVFTSAAASEARPLESLGDADNGMEYPTLIYDGAFSEAQQTGSPKALSARRVTEAEAFEAVRAFVGEARVLDIVSAPSTGGALPAWGVTVTTADLQLNAEVTVQGGQVLWMMPESAAFPVLLGAEACRKSAAAFLEERGFASMEATYAQVYEESGLCLVNFAAVQNGILLYPDLIKVQVRMDTGDVVGFEANNYLMNHVFRELPAPVLTEAQASARLSPELSLGKSRLCVIPVRRAELLCYEFEASRGDSRYLVYIDAATGETAQLLKLIDVHGGTLTA